MTRRLVVFSNDPIRRYYEKGEIKPRYYNPGNFFDEVHILSPCQEDIEPDKVAVLGGTARLFIHPLGYQRLTALFNLRERALKLVRELHPQVIRGYGTLIGSWIAVYCGQKLGIPVVVSIHNNNDEDIKYLLRDRALSWSMSNLRYLTWSLLTENYILRYATKVICMYEFAALYAHRHGAKNIKVIYNRIDTERFTPVERYADKDKLTVISVGNHIEVKNPEPLIWAIRDLNVRLVLIGNGPLHNQLVDLVEKLGLTEQVEFILAVSHAEIHRYYQQADIFALPILIGGIAMPVMEAMACSLPVVVSRPKYQPEPELVSGVGLVVDNTSQGFRDGLIDLMKDASLRLELGHKGREQILRINGRLMEQRERDLYAEMLERSA